MSAPPEYADRKAKWRATHPQRDRAQRQAQNENRRLARQGRTRVCMVCGAPNAEAHHVSYDPPVVEDRCEKHHQGTHREDGTGQARSLRTARNLHKGGLAHHRRYDIQGGLRHAPK